MQSIRARMAALTVAAVCVAVALAACGSSSSSSSSTKAAAAGGAVSSAARTKLVACLKQHGVTLPARPAGGHRPGAGSAAPGAGSGAGGSGAGGSGAGGGTPGSGAPGAGQGGGFFGGGGSGRFSNPKFQAAFKACGAAAGFRGGQGRFARFRPSKAAITAFAACVKTHGYTLPKANVSGKGSVYPVSVERSAKFQAASRSCAADLRPAGGAPPPAG